VEETPALTIARIVGVRLPVPGAGAHNASMVTLTPPLAQLIAYPRDTASAMIAASCVAGLGIAGAYTLASLSHAFTAIADSTAGGRDDVGWSSEPMIDRLTKAVWFSWAGLVAAAPSFIISRAVGGATVAFLALFAALFPIVVISLQTGHSPASVLHPEAIRRMVRKPLQLAGFAIASALAVGLVGLGIRFGLGGRAFQTPFGAFAAAVGLMIWARLIGRLGHVISRVAIRARGPRPTHRDERPRPVRPIVRDVAPSASQSTDAYGLRPFHDPEPPQPDPRPSLKRIWVEEGADDPYRFADGDSPTLPPQAIPAEMIQPSEYELALAIRNRPVRPPDHPWVTGTFTFPFRPANWSVLLVLTLGLTACGLLLRAASG
jgi:hypothetical protein